MTLGRLKSFFVTAKDDQTIQQRLKVAKWPEEVVSIAKQHGHEVAAEKLSQLS